MKCLMYMKCGYTTWFKVKVQKNAVATSSLQVLNKTTGKLVAKKKGTAIITIKSLVIPLIKIYNKRSYNGQSIILSQCYKV